MTLFRDSSSRRERPQVLMIGCFEADVEYDNYSITQVTSAWTGMLIAQYECPDIVVMDVSVAGAWLVARTLPRQIGRSVLPIVAVVPHDQPMMVKHAQYVGFTEIVTDVCPEALLDSLLHRAK